MRAGERLAGAALRDTARKSARKSVNIVHNISTLKQRRSHMRLHCPPSRHPQQTRASKPKTEVLCAWLGARLRQERCLTHALPRYASRHIAHTARLDPKAMFRRRVCRILTLRLAGVTRETAIQQCSTTKYVPDAKPRSQIPIRPNVVRSLFPIAHWIPPRSLQDNSSAYTPALCTHVCERHTLTTRLLGAKALESAETPIPHRGSLPPNSPQDEFPRRSPCRAPETTVDDSRPIIGPDAHNPTCSRAGVSTSACIRVPSPDAGEADLPCLAAGDAATLPILGKRCNTRALSTRAPPPSLPGKGPSCRGLARYPLRHQVGGVVLGADADDSGSHALHNLLKPAHLDVHVLDLWTPPVASRDPASGAAVAVQTDHDIPETLCEHRADWPLGE